MPLIPKRKPGGQPKNKNAEKHGFYAAGVSPALRRALTRAKELDNAGLYEEIRLARAYMTRLLAHKPANHDIIIRLVSTIARMVAVDHGLNRNEEDAIGGALQELLAELLPDREVP